MGNQDNLLFTYPLSKDVSNKIIIDLSGYVLNSVFQASLNHLQNTKQDDLLFKPPLLKEISKNITIYIKRNVH